MIAELLILAASAAAPHEETVVVTATRSERPLREQLGNTAVIGGGEIDLTAHTHASEILARAPGTWITRGSNQEHLAAIRSPILTGPGACGAFLYLEDGLPVRPSGFCNVNQLIELNTEQAAAIEVVRGPGSALYGSNALHGMVNVITRGPYRSPASAVGLEAGPNDFYRLRGTRAGDGDAHAWRASGLLARDGGWRDGSGMDQYKLNLLGEADTLDWSVSLTGLEQDTAAFILGENAYRDRATARSNPTPGAWRNMHSQRASLRWRTDAVGWHVTARPYARRSRMDFLQHFIPGDPAEENGHHSIGTQLLLRREQDGTLWLLGSDLEYADIFVRQEQAEPLVDASDFLNATRPQGRHYDFRVTAMSAAAFAHVELPLAVRWRLTGGLRVEHTRYDYDNRMADGNLRDDGTACGMGGCHYNRPADRRDDFTVATPKLGLSYRVTDAADAYLSAARGHRAPQVHELYRLQRGQDVADLDPERLDSLELGLRGRAGALQYDLALYAMKKRSVVFDDANGFAVSGGRTRHRGIELSASQTLSDTLAVSATGSLARHTWDFTQAVAGGETIRAGDAVPAAPRRLGSVQLRWQPAAGHRVELEWVRVGAYWLDAENTRRYGGHSLFNLRGMHDLAGRWQLSWRLTNLADRRYAERADFAFGDFRYFPGPPRQLHVGLRFNGL